MRSWFLRSICVGPVLAVDASSGSWPAAPGRRGVLTSTSLTSSTRSRSSSRSRTMIGYSLPPSRNMRGLRAGDVGADRVGDAGHGQAEQRRLRRDRRARPARDGLRRGRARASAMPGVVSSSVLTSLRRCAARRLQVVAADLERRARPSPLPPPGMRASCWLPPEARARTMTPGMPRQLRGAARMAICSLSACARPSAPGGR